MGISSNPGAEGSLMEHQQLPEVAASVQQPNIAVAQGGGPAAQSAAAASGSPAPQSLLHLPQLPFPQLPFPQQVYSPLQSAGPSLPAMESGSLPDPLEGTAGSAPLPTSPNPLGPGGGSAPVLNPATAGMIVAAAAAAGLAGATAGPSDFNGSTDRVSETTEAEGSLGDSRRSSRGRSRGRGRASRRSVQPRMNTGVARKSRYRGVQWEQSCNKWRARIHTDKTRHIGYFQEEDAAAQAFDMAALKHFGLSWKSKLNFPERSVAQFVQEQQGVGAAGGTAASGPAAATPPADAAPAVAVVATTRAYRGVLLVEGGKFKAALQRKRTYTTIGIYNTAEEAARAYDRENLRVNGRGAITNFPLSDYAADLERWQEAYNLVTGGQAPSSSLALPLHPSTTDVSTPKSGQGPSFAHPTQSSPGGEARGPLLGQQGSVTVDEPRVSGPSGGGVLDLPGDMPAVASGLVGTAVGGSDVSDYATKRRRVEAAGHPGGAVPTPPISGSVLEPVGGLTGVVEVGGRWQAYLIAELGTFSTAEEAARAHDRAALAVGGFTGALNSPLQEVLAGMQAACETGREEARQAQPWGQQQRQQLGVAGPEVEGYRGVVPRNNAYIAVLDIGGKPYDLGPFSSALEAARAFDRYSLLLLGTQARTNFPPWTYLAAEPEVQALVGEVQAVAHEQRTQQVQQQLLVAAATGPLSQPSAQLSGVLPGREGTSEQQGQLERPRPPPQSGAVGGPPVNIQPEGLRFGGALLEQQGGLLAGQGWPNQASGQQGQVAESPAQQQRWQQQPVRQQPAQQAAQQQQSMRLQNGGMLQFLNISLPPVPPPHPYFQQQQQGQQEQRWAQQDDPPSPTPLPAVQPAQQQQQQGQPAAPAAPAAQPCSGDPSHTVEASFREELSLDALINALSPSSGWLPPSLDSLCAALGDNSPPLSAAARPPPHWTVVPGALGSPLNLDFQQQQQPQQIPLPPMPPSFLLLPRGQQR